MTQSDFLPVSRADMEARDWYYYDFLLITGDAYIDHPSFGTAVIGRVLEADGYRVAVLAQPDWKSTEAFLAMGRPRYAALVGAGNLDSMVNHYTSAKKTRSEDFYSPGKKAGLRPDRATVVYANRVKEAFPDLPVVIGGLEASLRRFAHYDYWEDKVRRPILLDAKAELITYGMGEMATREIAAKLSHGVKINDITDIRGTGYIVQNGAVSTYPSVECASYEEVTANKQKYAEANMLQYDEHDPIRGKAVIQRCGDRSFVVNPPQLPLSTKEFDRISELPYTRAVHPMYETLGGVAAIEEVRFSVIHNRGCFGACNFCSLAFHQGRMVTSRSHESIIREVECFVKHPEFKGYVHDVGGPTANFRHPSCKGQLKNGMCRSKNCLTPTPCANLEADHSDYLLLLRKVSAIPGVKKVFIRSGIRFDYLLEDKSGEFFAELVKNHISGQLKVAPEHCIDDVLDYMGKPHNDVYQKFEDKYDRLNQRYGKKQFLVPYLISSHPGSTLSDAVLLAEYLNKRGVQPEQVQDFYPTPGTLSTCMYYTGIDPRTLRPIHVPYTFHEKAMQRALLQWRRPDKRRLVLEALQETGREDLIGFGKHCLVRPSGASTTSYPSRETKTSNQEGESKLNNQQGESETNKPPKAQWTSNPQWATKSSNRQDAPKPNGGRHKKMRNLPQGATKENNLPSAPRPSTPYGAPEERSRAGTPRTTSPYSASKTNNRPGAPRTGNLYGAPKTSDRPGASKPSNRTGAPRTSKPYRATKDSNPPIAPKASSPYGVTRESNHPCVPRTGSPYGTSNESNRPGAPRTSKPFGAPKTSGHPGAPKAGSPYGGTKSNGPQKREFNNKSGKPTKK